MFLGVILLIALGAAVFLIFARNKDTCSAASGSTVIILNDAGFDPATTTISRCTEVVFKNMSSKDVWPAADLHPTHLTYPEFDPQKPVLPNDSWSFIFNKLGTWKCHDHLSPFVRCVIRVTE